MPQNISPHRHTHPVSPTRFRHEWQRFRFVFDDVGAASDFSDAVVGVVGDPNDGAGVDGPGRMQFFTGVLVHSGSVDFGSGFLGSVCVDGFSVFVCSCCCGALLDPEDWHALLLLLSEELLLLLLLLLLLGHKCLRCT